MAICFCDLIGCKETCWPCVCLARCVCLAPCVCLARSLLGCRCLAGCRGFPIVTVSLGPQDTGSSRREVKLEQVPYHAPRTYMVGLPFEPEMYCNDW